MAKIDTKLNCDQFLAVYGQHEYVHGFTREAIANILDFVEEMSALGISEGHPATPVMDYFQYAVEVTSKELRCRYGYADDFDVDIIANAESYHQLSNGNYLQYN